MWSDEWWKIARRCGTKHIFKSSVKNWRSRNTFGSRHVEKVHPVVSRGTFPSQNVQSTPFSDHVWKLRCGKSARRCGAKRISKSKCTKHHMYGPLLDVQTSFRVSSAGDCASCQGWAKRDGLAAISITTTSTLHSTTVHSITLHYTTTTTTTTTATATATTATTTTTSTAKTTTTSTSTATATTTTSLRYTRLHYTTIHYTNYSTLRYNTFHYTTLHFTTLHGTTQHRITLNYTTLHYTTLHYTKLLHYTNYITLRYTSRHYTTLHLTTTTTTTTTTATLHCTTLCYTDYITLHSTPLHSITLQLHYSTARFITLHYAQLHYTTLHLQLEPQLQLQLRYFTLHYTRLHYIALPYITLHLTHYTSTVQLQIHYTNLQYSTTTTPLHYNYNYCCTTPHYIQQLWVRWPLQPLQPLPKTQLQPAFSPSVDSLCHPWFRTTNLSYRFPILKLPPPPCAVLLVLNHPFSGRVTIWTRKFSFIDETVSPTKPNQNLGGQLQSGPALETEPKSLLRSPTGALACLWQGMHQGLLDPLQVQAHPRVQRIQLRTWAATAKGTCDARCLEWSPHTNAPQESKKTSTSIPLGSQLTGLFGSRTRSTSCTRTAERFTWGHR